MKLKELYEKLYNKIFSVPLFKKLLKIPGVEKLLQYEIVSYLVFGVLTTVVNFVTYMLLGIFAGENYEARVLFSIGTFDFRLILLMNGIAWVVSVLFAFVTNKLFVFESSSWKPDVLIKEIISFFGARVVSFILFEELLFALLVSVLHINDLIAKLLIAVFVVIFNFVASKLVIFRKKGEKDA
ncbi:MAG: GtrA family protein [Clostridia bacterium]|nr:GtrA family protein [Clostridia bacterium]